MTTLEERLDELLAMSREVGRLSCELARWEKDAQYDARSWRGKNGRYFLRRTREEHQRAAACLSRARARFLATAGETAS